MNKIPEINNYNELEAFLDNADYYTYERITPELFNKWLMILLNEYELPVDRRYSWSGRYDMGEMGHIELDNLYCFALCTNGFDLRETDKCYGMWYS